MATVNLDAVTLVYADGTRAVDHLDLDLADRETVALLGASGCGKSSVLRLVAGLEWASEGTITIGGREVTWTPTRDRRVGMVTQSLAIPPGLSARATIELPLRFRHHAVDPELVREEARVHSIERLLDAPARQLSGGQQRLLQSARALVDGPEIVLLDEPFAGVDQIRRLRLRQELARRFASVTALLVTADQQDAMAMADRIGVMVDGRLVQLGPPGELYERPATVDVAGFLGSPPMVLTPAAVTPEGDGFRLRFGGATIRSWAPVLSAHTGTGVLVGIRPEHVSTPPAAGHVPVDAIVDLVEPAGRSTTLHVRTSDAVMLSLSLPGSGRYRPGDRLTVGFEERRIHLFDRVSGRALLHPLG